MGKEGLIGSQMKVQSQMDAVAQMGILGAGLPPSLSCAFVGGGFSLRTLCSQGAPCLPPSA